MEHFCFYYRPIKKSISFLQITRNAGYLGSTIHMHDHHELVLVDSAATCRIVNNGNTVTVNTPALILQRAGTFHEVVEITEGTYCSNILYFHPQSLSEIPSSMIYEKELLTADLTVLSLSPEQVQAVKPLLHMIDERGPNQKLPLLLCLLAQAAQLLEEGTDPIQMFSGKSYIFDVIDLIQSGTETCITLSQLAGHFHVSQTKLQNDFKRITGLPVHTFQNYTRLQKARTLLDSTQMEQSQIAYTCSFSDESAFIRAFRKRYGVTPGAYRRNKEII